MSECERENIRVSENAFYVLQNMCYALGYTVSMCIWWRLCFPSLCERKKRKKYPSKTRHWGLHGKFYFPFLFSFYCELFYFLSFSFSRCVCVCVFAALLLFIVTHSLVRHIEYSKKKRDINIQETFPVLIGILYVFQASKRTNEKRREKKRGERERERESEIV